MAQARHILITGQTESGKTSFARLLLARAPRAIVLDRFQDYDNGEVFYDFNEAVDFWLANRKKNFRLIFRGNGDVDQDNEAFRAWLTLVWESQRQEHLPPIALFLEEASYYRDEREWPEIRSLYLYGRRWHINLVAVTQRDVLVPPFMRDNSHYIVAFRNMKLSNDFATYFSREQCQQITALESFNPTLDPIEGRYFLVYPTKDGGSDILDAWDAVMS